MNEALEALKNTTSWKWRRWFVFGIAVWCMGLVTYNDIVGTDAARESVSFNLTGLLITLVGTYLFGASWDGQNARKATLAAQAIPQGGGTSDTQVQVNP